jgi:hypothetical protein
VQATRAGTVTSSTRAKWFAALKREGSCGELVSPPIQFERADRSRNATVLSLESEDARSQLLQAGDTQHGF